MFKRLLPFVLVIILVSIILSLLVINDKIYPEEILPLLLIFILPLVLLIGGICFLVEYKKTKQRKFLIVGLILTLVVVGFFILLALSFIRSQSTMMYMAL